ncbi:MAG: PAS domain-containing protein [Anaerolineales bacterium]|nr:PAS domain-containing protein [Anaerolineales bacterium]
MLDSSADVIWAIDANYNYLLGSNTFRNYMLSTFDFEFKHGKCVFNERIPEHLHRLWKQQYDRALQGESFTLEAQQSSSSRWFEYHYRPIIDVDGGVIGAVIAGHDITERKHAEDALRQSERRYRLLADNMNDIVWILNIESGMFSYVSPSIERLTGYSVEEVMMCPFVAAVTPESRELMGEILARAASI